MNSRRTGTQDTRSAPTKEKGLPAFAALLRGFAIGALMLCGSAPAFAAPATSFDAAAHTYVTIPQVVGLDFAVPTDDSHLVSKAEIQPSSDFVGSASASAVPTGPIASSLGFPVKLGALASASGSATAGSVFASAFASAYVLLEITGSNDPLDVKILFDIEASYPGDSPLWDFEMIMGNAFAQAGTVISLSSDEDTNPSLVKLFDDDDVTQIGWLATLLPGDAYKLEVSAAAEGTANAATVPEARYACPSRPRHRGPRPEPSSQGRLTQVSLHSTTPDPRRGRRFRVPRSSVARHRPVEPYSAPAITLTSPLPGSRAASDPVPTPPS